MGQRIIEVPLDNERTVFVEVSDSDSTISGDALSPIAGVGETFTQASRSVQAALDNVIKPVIETIGVRLVQGVHPPDSMELEFGLKLSAKVGVVLSSTEAEAHITVKMAWKRSQLETVPPPSQ
ncbi:CU044_2847 family protein [Nocardia sp. NPDC046763]|uniref:CU044_2847 family protein n=1 Tax=Nocardia sp. NPDC046763 TaxID=3155256 RepID=UPI0033E611FB